MFYLDMVIAWALEDFKVGTITLLQ
jgi:hypothetical protein